MKTYTKPCIEYIELRAEESLACTGSSGFPSNIFDDDKVKGKFKGKGKDKDKGKDIRDGKGNRSWQR